MKKLIVLLIFLANISCENEVVDEKSCCLSNYPVTLFVDFLYWKECLTDLDYTPIPQNNDPTKYLRPSPEIAVRIGGRVYCNAWDFAIKYTRFTSETSKRIGVCEFEETGPEIAIINHEIDLKVFDFEFGYTLLCALDDVVVRPIWGLKRAWVDELEERNCEIGPDTLFINDLDYRGTGVYLGSYLELPFLCGSSIVTRGTGAIMEGRLKFFSNDNNPRCKECFYHYIAEVFAGIKYDCNYLCYETDIIVGYEAQWWAWRRKDNREELAHLGLSGLTARLNLHF